jgi:hypothetical protein
MTTAPATIELSGMARFPLAFVPQLASREAVMLGVVPVGAIEMQTGGRCWWSLDLPLVRKQRRAGSIKQARDDIRVCLIDWIEALTADGAFLQIDRTTKFVMTSSHPPETDPKDHRRFFPVRDRSGKR